jgi:SAM-dependent methyltransferase
MDIERHNRDGWNRLVDAGDRWTRPVSSGQIEAARRGEWEVLLTPTRPVPRGWFGPLEGTAVLCLASGGGQQAPILAAAGAEVTVLDNSPRQLDQDRIVAERDDLEIRLEQGTMVDLSRFDDGSFDLIVHPVSNVFVPDLRPLWKEAFRVLREGGHLLAGISNPLIYLFDEQELGSGRFVVRHSLPYSDLTSLTPEELQGRFEKGEPLEFGHTLEDQLGGQIEAGFDIVGLYEDRDPDSTLSRYAPTFMATRALR